MKKEKEKERENEKKKSVKSAVHARAFQFSDRNQ